MSENLMVGSHKSSNAEYRNGCDRIFGKSVPTGFRLAHIKGEGNPIHPDDLDCDFTPAQYAKQLKAYKDCYGIPE